MARCHCALLFLALAFGVSGTSDVAVRQGLSPVTRVVELLESLSKKIDLESETEEGLYKKFVCWGKTVVSEKTASNAAADSRIEMLSTYIADLDAGRIELTTERVDLEKEIEQVRGSIEIATEIRAKEESDYEMAAEEMQKAIDALTSAIQVLRTATEDHTTGVLLKFHSKLTSGEGAEARSAESSALSQALTLGDKFLTKGDALFLRRLLTGEVPTWDWKKLNRKATFKSSYKARSFKIQEVLAKLLETFSTNLAEAGQKEKEAKDLFDKLMISKGAERDAAQDALGKLEKENGAKFLSREESVQELTDLKKQVSDDTDYIADVQKSLDQKKIEWKERSELRQGEVAAISKAISILRNDDSRDLFKKSFASQGYSLLQQGQVSHLQTHGRGAAAALRQAASAAGDRRLEVLAVRAASGGHFDEVISAIDKMLAILQTEESGDLKKKEGCEADRASDTREAILASRTIDEMSDLVTTLTTEIAEITAEMEQKTKEVAEITAQLEEAKRIRADENAAFLLAKKDDEDAHALVGDALEVIKTFYKENGLMFAQKRQAPVVTAGAAPPPPPTTWEAPYGGKTSESTGIVAVLDMIQEDIAKDMKKAADAEAKALFLYETTKKLLEGERIKLNDEIVALDGTKGKKITKRSDTKGERRLKKGDLDVVLKKIKDAEAGCDFFTINFPARTSNRQIEVDGLLKAKAILSKAVFAPPEDESREIKPGDALLQRARRHIQ
mmetsp:Transcript_124141/g.276987  ORF Transcript_124141/g.276987 Transcript_124141/m.276987 type:complete len:732 (+) Transcript_124141:74-2269(+)